MPESVFPQTMPLDCAEAICELEAPPMVAPLLLVLAFFTDVAALGEDSVDVLAAGALAGAGFGDDGAEAVAGALDESEVVDFLRVRFEVPLAWVAPAAGALLALDGAGAAAGAAVALVESAVAVFLWLRLEVLAGCAALLAPAAG